MTPAITLSKSFEDAITRVETKAAELAKAATLRDGEQAKHGGANLRLDSDKRALGTAMVARLTGAPISEAQIEELRSAVHESRYTVDSIEGIIEALGVHAEELRSDLITTQMNLAAEYEAWLKGESETILQEFNALLQPVIAGCGLLAAKSRGLGGHDGVARAIQQGQLIMPGTGRRNAFAQLSLEDQPELMAVAKEYSSIALRIRKLLRAQ
jgi:hypothetical protein